MLYTPFTYYLNVSVYACVYNSFYMFILCAQGEHSSQQGLSTANDDDEVHIDPHAYSQVA